MAPKDTYFTIKKGRIAAEPGTLLQESVPLGWEVRDMDGNESKDFTVNVGDWVMFNWGAEGGWMKGEVKRKCTSTRDIKKGCTHILRHAQLSNKDRDWVVALKETNYVDGSNQPGRWAFIRRLK